uniref:Polyadenylate-binding protein n=1 Tax=Parastrongyloides trichosuri TaxID=131310 RepID=A0A0N4ZD31_PARTI
MAMDTMNFEPLMGRPMRIMWSQRDPSLRRSGAGNVFIKNMDKSIDTKSVYDTFSMFGNILSCKVAVDENGVSLGYGFIHFETEESAQKAIDRVNGMLLDGKIVYVGKFIQRDVRSKESSTNPKSFTNVFVKNFEDKIDDDMLRKMFSKFGEITSAVVMRTDDGKSKGFGFVCFKDAESAAKAVAELNDSIVPNTDRKLYVGCAQKKNERIHDLKQKHDLQKRERLAKFDGVNLYVKNLDDNVTDEQLREQFEGFGNITSAKIMRDEQDRSKGFGFVCYESRSDATKAVTEMNGKMFGTKPLYVALAQRKEERKAQLATQYLRTFPYNRMNPQLPQVYGNHAPGGFYLNAPMQNGRGHFGPSGVNAGQVRNNAPRWNSYQNTGGFNGNPQNFQQQMQSGYQNQNIRGNRPQGGNQNAPRQYTQRMQRNNMPQQGMVRGPGVNSPMGGNKPMHSNYYGGMQQRQAQPMGGQMQPEMYQSNTQEPLTAYSLSKASVQEQKQMIGERIYPLVAKNCKDSDVGKITGMMLEMDNSELLMMLDNEELLQSKVAEAANVLNNAAKSGNN